MKKVLFICIFALLLTVSLSRYSRHINERERRDMDRAISIGKFMYASNLSFDFSIVVDGERIISSWEAFRRIVPPYPDLDVFYTDLIFVHSEAEAVGFPDNVVLAWPWMGTNDFSQGIVNGIHWVIDPANEMHILRGRQVREIVTLEDVGLNYPLTVNDLTDNWEKVRTLWHMLETSERNMVIRAAPVGGPWE